MLLGQLTQDGGSIYHMGDPTRKILDSYTELKLAPNARRWDPITSPDPTSMVMLHMDGGNPEGDLVIVSRGRIGGGTYGSIYNAVVLDKDRGTIPVVVKLTNRAEVVPPRSFVNEVLVMWDNSSDPACEIYATCLYGVFKSRFGSADPDKYFYGIVMERMDGDLVGLCKSVGDNPHNTAESKLYFLIYCGLHMIYDVWRLHDRGYFHNDIKPGNFLYYRMDNGMYRIKLADFGLSCSKKNTHLEQKLQKYRDSGKINVTPQLYASYIPCRAIGTLAFMSETMKIYQGTHGRSEEIVNPMLFVENDIHAITVSLKQMASLLNLSDADTDFRSYDDTPVSRALYSERMSPSAMMDAYNKAILYFERRGVPLPKSASLESTTAGNVSQFTEERTGQDVEMLPAQQPSADSSQTQLQETEEQI